MALALAGLLSACAATAPAPPALPAVTVPAAYATTLPASPTPVPLARWWDAFGDPALPRLIDAALAQSPTVEQALARRDQARIAARLSGVAGQPRLNARVDASRSAQAQAGATGLAVVPASQASTGFEASWEVDLFGRLARGREAAQAQAEAAEYLLHAARVSLSAEVARLYIQARGCRAQREGLLRSIASLDESLVIEDARVTVGRLAASELSHIRASRAELQVRVHAEAARCAGADAGLRSLTGLPAAALAADLDRQPNILPRFAGQPGQPLPADLLRQRPDIAASERSLAAALARIDEAEAARYPSLALAGSLSWQALSSGGADFHLRTWSLAPALLVPLFDGGQRAAQVDLRRAEAREAAAGWRQAVLRAVAEAEQAMGEVHAGAYRLPASVDVLAQYRTALEAQEARRRVGRTGILDVENARRDVYGAEARALDAEEGLALLWVALYRSLGGHWALPGAVEKGRTDDDKRTGAARAAPPG